MRARLCKLKSFMCIRVVYVYEQQQHVSISMRLQKTKVIITTLYVGLLEKLHSCFTDIDYEILADYNADNIIFFSPKYLNFNS